MQRVAFLVSEEMLLAISAQERHLGDIYVLCRYFGIKLYFFD